jgi:NADH dehydrogenase (ubiquinone) Fe-S protein 3
MILLKKIFNLKISYLLKILFSYIFEIWIVHKEIEIRCKAKYILPLMLILKKHSLFQYKTLIDIVVYDQPGKFNRFSILYVLSSFCFNSRILVRTQITEFENLQSLILIFSNANWLEREVWDFFGIFFLNHPDLRRILTDYGFTGHPLRKDFPLTGYIESFYSEFCASNNNRNIELIQEYRFYFNI